MQAHRRGHTSIFRAGDRASVERGGAATVVGEHVGGASGLARPELSRLERTVARRRRERDGGEDEDRRRRRRERDGGSSSRGDQQDSTTASRRQRGSSSSSTRRTTSHVSRIVNPPTGTLPAVDPEAFSRELDAEIVRVTDAALVGRTNGPITSINGSRSLTLGIQSQEPRAKSHEQHRGHGV